MAKSKLKTALGRHQGRNIPLEKQRKQEKEARKRKERKRPQGDEDEEEVEGGVSLVEEETQVKANGRAEKHRVKKQGVKGEKPVVEVEEEEWETDESEDEGEDDEMPDQAAIDFSRLEDSDSEGSSSDDNAAAPSAEASDSDPDAIPLSDLESVASDDKGDIIPHQRLTINNVPALTAALHRFQLPYRKLAFSEHMSTTSDEPTSIPDADDDLNRELAFYKQALASAKDARAALKKEGVPFSRPADYFAEMVKSEEHMGKVKQKLVDEAAGKKAAAEARRQRDLKKFGKQVQVARMQERAKEKREAVERIGQLKRKRSGAPLTSTSEAPSSSADLFDIELDNSTSSSTTKNKRPSSSSNPTSTNPPNPKRQKKNAKFGFGGKKRHAKSNDAKSSADASGFDVRKMKGGGAGASKRLGKSRRVQKGQKGGR